MIVLMLVGLAVVFATLLDVYATTIAMRGGGPLTERVASSVWRRVARSRRTGHRFMQVVGAFILPLTVIIWTLLLYAGWVLVFSSHPNAVVSTATDVPAALTDRAYYTGYLLSTLGNGEYRPDGFLWQVLTVSASMSGLALFTLAISYVTPVVSAVVQKRQLAMTINGWGETVEEVLTGAWDGHSFASLQQDLATAKAHILRVSQQHLAYPVLHYFHSLERRGALPLAVALLDEVLTLLRHGVAPDRRLDALTLRGSWAAVDSFLAALEATHLHAPEDAPDAPSLALLDKLDIPRVNHEDYEQAIAGLQRRRAVLRAFVENDGWQWAE